MRQQFIHLAILTLITIGNTKAQDAAVNIEVDTLSPSVFMLTGEGGNIGLFIGEAYAFMIDDQFDRLSDKIKATIAGLTDKPLAYLFNTHMHGDHTGGNASFNSGQTTIVAHDNVRERVRDNQQKALEENKITPEYLSKMLPEVTFSQDITFYDGTETIMAFHVHNAHTDGDAMVYFVSNNVLHMGDTYFAGRYPYIDLNSGGSVEGYINAQKKALMVINDETRIIPGHGRPSNRKELENYVAMLEDIRNNVLHMGDTYFAGRYPYIDLNSGGSVEGYINAQKKALMVINDETRIIPGHGRPSHRKELENYVAMLEDIRNNVQQAITEGKTPEEIQADTSISGVYDEDYGSGFINPKKLRETFYTSLKKD